MGIRKALKEILEMTLLVQYQLCHSKLTDTNTKNNAWQLPILITNPIIGASLACYNYIPTASKIHHNIKAVIYEIIGVIAII